jgi:hypothetical protein
MFRLFAISNDLAATLATNHRLKSGESAVERAVFRRLRRKFIATGRSAAASKWTERKTTHLGRL